MTTSSFLTVEMACDEALQMAKHKLSQAGLRALQTFDLHAARHALRDTPCPKHGAADCDCQMVILMVYGETPEPATLILHGNDGQTWFSIVDGLSQQVDKTTIARIHQTFAINAPASA